MRRCSRRHPFRPRPVRVWPLATLASSILTVHIIQTNRVYLVDVQPKPIGANDPQQRPPNPAHAQIEPNPPVTPVERAIIVPLLLYALTRRPLRAG